MWPSRGRIVTVLAPLVLLLPPTLPGLQKPGRPYESPLHNFSVVVPELAFGTRVQKANNSDDGMLSCLGEMGDVRRIDYQRLPPDFPYPSDSAALHAFGQVVLRDLLAANPGTIVNDGPVQIDGQDAWFALVTLFRASRVIDSTGQRRDATRGVLVFGRSGFAYTLHAEQGVVAAPLEAERAKQILTEFYQRITFH
jgi:hypothetical protein